MGGPISWPGLDGECEKSISYKIIRLGFQSYFGLLLHKGSREDEKLGLGQKLALYSYGSGIQKRINEW